MTDALAQNSENITSTADILLNLKNGNLASRNTQTNDSFSNLINTLDANTKKVQTDFVKKAVKSNTSSINKLAIKNNAQTTNRIEKNKFQASKEIDKYDELKKDTEIDFENDTDKKIQDLTPQKEVEKKEDVNKTNEIEKSSVNEVLDEETDKKELSDINNSSPVESSPVFSLNETTNDIKLDEQDKKEIKDILNNVLISFGVDTAQNKELDSGIDEILSKVETLDEVPNAIDEVFASLDNLNLSDENKENLFQSFKDIKDVIGNAVKNYNSDSEILAQAKSFIDELNSSSQTLIQKDNLLEIRPTENKDTDDIEMNNVSSKSVLDENEISKTLDDIKYTIKEIKDTIEKHDFKNLDTLLKDLDNLIKTADDSDLNVDKQVLDSVSDLKNEIAAVLKSVENQDLSLKNDEFIKIKNDTEDILSKLEVKPAIDEDTSKINDFQNENVSVDVENQEKDTSLSEVLEAFNDFKNSSDYEKLNNEDKEKFDEFVNKIVDLQTQNADVSANNVQTDKKIVQETIKEINAFVDGSKKDIQVDDIDLPSKEDTLKANTSSENMIDLSDIFEQVGGSSNNESDLNQNNNSTSYDEAFAKVAKTIKADFNNSDLNITQENVQETEVNIQKETFIDAIQDDMLMDISFQDGVESGALSVADEVAKMALNHQNASLNAATTVHSAISYDSFAPEISMIKNAAQMMKTQTSAQSQNEIGGDIFNQITNKITQLKDAQGQKLTMVLRPHNLGRLSIELTTNHLGLTTNILAQNDDVRAYIEKNIDSLRQQLSDAGVNVNNIQIKTMGQEGSTNYQGNNHNFDSNQQNQQNQNANSQNQQRQNHQEQRENKEFLADISNYDLHFAKDFSSVLNKTISYNLN